MSTATVNEIQAIAALTSALAAAIEDAKKAGLSAGQVLAVIEPITEILGNDE